MEIRNEIEKEFLKELIEFFKTITAHNRDADKYNEITNLILSYRDRLEKEWIIFIYVEYGKEYLQNDWDEDVYVDIQERLTGFSSYNKRIDLD